MIFIWTKFFISTLLTLRSHERSTKFPKAFYDLSRSKVYSRFLRRVKNTRLTIRRLPRSFVMLANYPGRERTRTDERREQLGDVWMHLLAVVFVSSECLRARAHEDLEDMLSRYITRWNSDCHNFEPRRRYNELPVWWNSTV